jgi:hypothetical protein
MGGVRVRFVALGQPRKYSVVGEFGNSAYNPRDHQADRPITNVIMPNCGETPGIQSAIPIAIKKNAHRWMFLIVPSLS